MAASPSVHPLEGGYFRLKFRRDRRPTLPRERPWIFYPRYGAELASKHVSFGLLIARLWRLRRRIKADSARKDYKDQALSPVSGDDIDVLEMFAATDAAKGVAERRRQAVARQLSATSPPKERPPRSCLQPPAYCRSKRRQNNLGRAADGTGGMRMTSRGAA